MGNRNSNYKNSFADIQWPSSLKTRKARVKVTLADFCIIKLVGRGSYGKVYKVRYLKDNSIYAMKILSKHLINDQGQDYHVRAERKIMAQVYHPFIVKLRYAFQTNNKLYLIMDYYAGGTLFNLLSHFKVLSEDWIQFYAAEILLGLEWLHNLEVVYRDLKTENILIDTDGHIKLADFGSAKENTGTYSGAKTICGTPEYQAPEILNGEEYGCISDMWALGILLYEMAVGKTPFYHPNYHNIYRLVLESEVEYPNTMSKNLKHLISALLEKKPKRRLTLSKVKNHRFFKNISWDQVKMKHTDPPIVPQTTALSKNSNNVLLLDPADSSESEESEDECISKINEFENFSYSQDWYIT